MKKTIPHFFLALFLTGIGQIVQAQQIKAKADTSKSKAQQKNATVIKTAAHPIVASITAGATGIGVELKRLMTRNLNLRLGYSFLPKISVVRASTTDFDNNTSVDGNFSNLHLLAEYAPFKNIGVHLVGGAAYILELKTDINQVPTGNYSYGDIIFTPDEIGTIHTVADWKGFAWYGGVSFFKLVPKKRFNITLDLGTYYLSQPKTSIMATNLLAQNASENNQIHWHENIGQYRWLPVLQLNFNFKLGK